MVSHLSFSHVIFFSFLISSNAANPWPVFFPTSCSPWSRQWTEANFIYRLFGIEQLLRLFTVSNCSFNWSFNLWISTDAPLEQLQVIASIQIKRKRWWRGRRTGWRCRWTLCCRMPFNRSWEWPSMVVIIKTTIFNHLFVNALHDKIGNMVSFVFDISKRVSLSYLDVFV